MNSVKSKKQYICELCKQDIRYRNMRLACGILEAKADAVLKRLPKADRDAVWDFIMLCEDMSNRELEIACEVLGGHDSMAAKR